MAIPYLTVDKVTGQSVAQYPDGRMSPMGTSQGFMSQEGWVGGDTNPGTGWGGIPTPQPQAALATGRGSGDSGAPSAPGSLGGQSGADFYDETGWTSGPLGSAGGLGDRRVERPRTTSDALRGVSGAGPGSRDLAVDRAPGSLSSGYGSDVGSAHGDRSGGGGAGFESVGSRLADARSRLASAKSEVQSRLGAAGIGNGGGGYSSGGYSSSGYSSGSTTKPPKPDKLHGKYVKGLDASQAAGLTARDSMMIPRVFKGLTPASPLYSTISNLPLGAMGQIMGKGTVQSTAKKIGKFTHAAGTTGNIPSSEELINHLTRGKGVEDMFQGVKAKKGDYPSSIAPGYVYGQEPLSAAEAASQYGTLLDAALSGLPQQTAAKYGADPGGGGWGDYLIDKWGSKAMKKPAGKGAPIYKYVGRRLFR